LYVQPDATSSGRKANCRIQSVGVDGNGANQADSGSYANIVVTNTSRALVEDVYSYNARPGLTVTANQRAYCLLLTDDETDHRPRRVLLRLGLRQHRPARVELGRRQVRRRLERGHQRRQRPGGVPARVPVPGLASACKCTFDNTCADGALSTGVTVHGSQYAAVFTDCYHRVHHPRNGHLLVRRQHRRRRRHQPRPEQPLPLGHARRVQRLTATFTGCTIVGKRERTRRSTATASFVRGPKIMGGVIRHTADNSAVCVQLDGSLSSSGRSPRASAARCSSACASSSSRART
jgi:hypothetical protein